MSDKTLKPDYIFEASWEVCNKVGGIYTVLSTRARILQEAMPDRLIFIGPDCWKDCESPFFEEDKKLFADWRSKAFTEGINVRIGRWTVPGRPIAILVDFTPYFDKKNEIYGWLWEQFQVDSLHAYGDYDEASMFSYAAGLVTESYYNYFLNPFVGDSSVEAPRVIFHANEWMCGLGALYIKKKLPQIGTIFTTHATSIGRSIAGNNKPLYDYLWAYNGDQMAGELNMQSKHSIEKQTAHNVDCFTTVSDITARECKELLDKEPDVVLPNGFDGSFLPKNAATHTRKRREARKSLLRLANCLIGEEFGDDTMIVATSGRYEFRNKGIDVFIESMNRLLRCKDLKKKVLAFILVPGWVGDARQDLVERINSGETFTTPLDTPLVTHWLHEMSHDNVISMLKYHDMHNRPEDMVKTIFLPCYLNGDDGVLNRPYYDLLLANDLSVFPSYYEPWGYTPLESVAFKVPCITTDLAGFGLWANKVKVANVDNVEKLETSNYSEIENGAKVIHRTDYNYSEVADTIKDVIAAYSNKSEKEVNACRKAAETLSKKALWSEFIPYYYKAYDIALNKSNNKKL